MHQHNQESAEFRKDIESDLIYLGTFGFEDPLNLAINKTVQLIRYGKKLEDDELPPDKDQVQVRMITGDHILTAKKIAIDAGIISEAESNTDGLVLTGDEYIERLGGPDGYEKKWNEKLGEYDIEVYNRDAFNRLK